MDSNEERPMAFSPGERPGRVDARVQSEDESRSGRVQLVKPRSMCPEMPQEPSAEMSSNQHRSHSLHCKSLPFEIGRHGVFHLTPVATTASRLPDFGLEVARRIEDTQLD